MRCIRFCFIGIRGLERWGVDGGDLELRGRSKELVLVTGSSITSFGKKSNWYELTRDIILPSPVCSKRKEETLNCLQEVSSTHPIRHPNNIGLHPALGSLLP